MFFYWRIYEEMLQMGQTLIFLEPSLKRCFHDWLIKHAEMVFLADSI
mgnify:CR=1 FL=1